MLQILVKKLSNTCTKLGVPSNLLLKQFAVYYHWFFENFESLIILTGELWHWNTCWKLQKKQTGSLYEHFSLLFRKE